MFMSAVFVLSVTMKPDIEMTPHGDEDCHLKPSDTSTSTTSSSNSSSSNDNNTQSSSSSSSSSSLTVSTNTGFWHNSIGYVWKFFVVIKYTFLSLLRIQPPTCQDRSDSVESHIEQPNTFVDLVTNFTVGDTLDSTSIADVDNMSSMNNTDPPPVMDVPSSMTVGQHLLDLNEFTDDMNEECPELLVWIFNLELNAFHKSKLYRCDKYNLIRFRLAPSLYGRNVLLYSNYCDDYTQFKRDEYKRIPFQEPFGVIQFHSSGSFHFYYVEAHKPKTILGSFYLVVSPELTIYGSNQRPEETLSVNAIQCQTVLSKCMGPIDSWLEKLQVTLQGGYNMIHWTPIQELGRSRSAYSLANQHKVNPEFSSSLATDECCTLDEVRKIIDQLRSEHGVLSITDIVLNHTANESPWLQQHPDAAYNCANSPWLRPAFLLDRLFWHLTLDIEDDRWVSHGLTTQVYNESHLDSIRSIFKEYYLPVVKLEEFYLCNIEQILEKFENYLINFIFGENASKADLDNLPIVNPPIKLNEEVSLPKLLQDPEYKRSGCSIDFEVSLKYVLSQVPFEGDIEDRAALTSWIDFSILHFEKILKNLNDERCTQINNHLMDALENVIKGCRYERLDDSGPKVAKVSRETPLATQYFTDELNGHNNKDLIQIEKSLFDESKSCFYMAHNGWVMGDDPLRNFAEEDSWVYLRRELICWGDSVKLRYGNKPEDSPYLWNYMMEYVQQMASTFHGLRLDNCHSTPISVAQYMLDAARRVNPDMYLIAELFTASEDLDNIFVNKLGINSLIREGMSASTPFELGRQVYRFGGDPVGSFPPEILKSEPSGSGYHMRPLVPSVAHAILFDQTHDNESPIVRRTPFDPLASSALISMTYSAIGSNRGLDELVPHHIHVVKEERTYQSWDKHVNFNTGILRGKRIINELHQWLAKQGYSQMFVDQRDRDTVVVTRHNPHNHRSVILAARTTFYPLDQDYASSLAPLRIEGQFEKILIEMRMSGEKDEPFNKDSSVINGLSKLHSQVRLMLNAETSEIIRVEHLENEYANLIHFVDFPPSSVVVFSVTLLENQRIALKAIQEYLQQYDQSDSEINTIVNALDLLDLNYVLFRCNQEEVDETGNGTYTISTGPFTYCGLSGVMFHMAKIRTFNDLGHPLCANLRDGDWLPKYIVARLKRHPSTERLAIWLEKVFAHLSAMPRYLIPRYFDSILLPLYTRLLDRVWSLSSEFVHKGDNFTQRLALGAVALIGSHPPSPLAPLAIQSIPPSLVQLPPNQLPTIAAGFPHFASGYMRNWGRDTFISLKGLTLLTGRFEVAKIIILGFAGTLRHGLIPNLLDGGNNPRFNSRDAVWWWLQAIKDYIQTAPEGHTILEEQVRRIFPTDDSVAILHDNDNQLVLQPLHQTIQEALERHFSGIEFVERNAGTQIDAHMKSEGFHMKVGVNRDTGFVWGGNEWNCGTWMDKMGSSDKAGNRGHPATPRDGSAVEIVGLCKSVVTFLAELYRKQQYPYESVQKRDETGSIIEQWTFDEWSDKIQKNFETHFYVNERSQEKLINRRAIYKDTVGATKPWMDYQLRPNFLVAMCVAHELFDREHALKALDMVDHHLLGPLGMKTLDPSDWNYCGDYANSNDSTDFNLANGFNYHNGPEWLWPAGYYFMARIKFIVDRSQELCRINKLLAKHYEHLCQSEWFGLPELTNTNGSPCHDSCAIQAWSHATLLELLHLKHFIENNMLF